MACTELRRLRQILLQQSIWSFPFLLNPPRNRRWGKEEAPMVTGAYLVGEASLVHYGGPMMREEAHNNEV